MLTSNAIDALVKIAALELAPGKIRVNAVNQGPVATEIMRKIGLDSQLEEQLIGSIPLSRFGKPDEVADMISLLSGKMQPLLQVPIFWQTVANRSDEKPADSCYF